MCSDVFASSFTGSAGHDCTVSGRLETTVRTALFPTFLHLVQGIWVIFSVKADYDRLCVAISCAGSPVQILTQDQAAQSVLQDLNKATAKATPKEVGNKGLTDLTCAQCCLLPPPSSANA